MNLFNRIRKWFNDSPIITTVDQRRYKLLQGGEKGDVFLTGKVIQSYGRKVGPKGDSKHSFSISESLAAKVTDDEHETHIIEVQLDDCDEIIGLHCKPNGKFYKKIFKGAINE